MQNSLVVIARSVVSSLPLPLHPGGDFQTQRTEADEAGGVVLVVGPALAGWVSFHRHDTIFVRRQCRVNPRIQGKRT
jgi:hypothetical protein